jgi:hypothetical protein
MLLYFLSACVTGEEGVIAAGRAASMREGLDRRQAHRLSLPCRCAKDSIGDKRIARAMLPPACL